MISICETVRNVKSAIGNRPNQFLSIILFLDSQKQPSRGVLRKRCSENMQQMYRRTPMPKCDFNKVAKQLYWNHTSAWVFSCRFAAYFQNNYFPKNTCGPLILDIWKCKLAKCCNILGPTWHVLKFITVSSLMDS